MSLFRNILSKAVRDIPSSPTTPTTEVSELPTTSVDSVPRVAHSLVEEIPEDLSAHTNLDHPEDYVTSKVEHQDRIPELSRGGRRYIHGSSLIGMCARREVLAHLVGAGNSSVKPQDRIVWAIGRAVESHIRKQFLTAVDREGVLGRWECRCRESLITGQYNDALTCSNCGSKLDKYREIPLFDEDANIVGNPDLVYVRPDNQLLRVVEIKSKKKELFDTLTRPEANHIAQAEIYQRLLNLSGRNVDMSGVTIVYASKDYAFRGSAYKEYHVPYCEDRQRTLDSMWDRANQVKDYHDEDTPSVMPERLPQCVTMDATRAKSCDQCVGCFSV